MSEQQSAGFRYKSVLIHRAGADKEPALDITNLVVSLVTNESLTSPFMTGSLTLLDAAGFFNDLPLQGTELIKIELFTTHAENSTTEAFNFRVWTLKNRLTTDKIQFYTLGLISEEGFLNELVDVYKGLKGEPSDIVGKLLKQELKTNKPYNSQPSKFQVKMVGAGKSPFSIISILSTKSVPKISNANWRGNQVKGTAGYLFWETRKGYNFYSIDALCSNPNDKFYAGNFVTWGEYREVNPNLEGVGDIRYAISKITMMKEHDIMKSLRKGKYCTDMCFLDFSTGQYQEYIHKISDTYNDMEHLGKQDNIETIQAADKVLSDFPSRRMVAVIDHETWHNELSPASPNKIDGSSSPSDYADRSINTFAQNIARNQLAANQKCKIIVPGNLFICAGDKIDIRIRNKVPDARLKEYPWDPESSGRWLVSETSNQYTTLEVNGGHYYTTLVLIRDSYGYSGGYDKSVRGRIA